MTWKMVAGVVTLSATLFGAGLVRAQGSRSSLSGVVTDPGGGVLPGVTVVVTNEQTGTDLSTITNDSGVFSVPALDVGSYTVTFTLSGFKTAVVKNVAVVVGNPANVTVAMDIGTLEETVSVSATGELVQTQTTTVSTTMNADSLKTLPFVTRNLMDSIPLLVGIDSAGAAGDNRDARVNGLPGQSVAITMDGVSIKSAQGESDFYAYVFPTIDSVEQVTVTGATQGADSSGGSAAVRFVTRSGGQRYSGSVFEYFRHPSLNTNYYFNKINGLEKNNLIVSQMGGTMGGPLQIPGLLRGRSKAFFFVAHEEFVQPVSSTVTRTVLTPQARQGVFRYVSGGTVREVNLFALAAQNAQTSVPDVTTTGLLKIIHDATQGTGLLRDTANPNTQQFVYQPETRNWNHFPTVRLDFNLPKNQKLTGTYRRTHLDRGQGAGSSQPNFPGLPVGSRYDSIRTVGSVALRSIVNTSVVNEVTVGWQNQTTQMGRLMTADMFANQGGFSLGLPLGATSASSRTSYNNRRAPLRSIDNKLSWQHGSHAISFGGSWQRISDDIYGFPFVPTVQFGVQTGLDPADAIFTTANFPGASSANLTQARDLYGYLTGRVIGLTADAALQPDGNYQYLGRTTDNHHLDEFGVFIQDQWRATPTLTLNYGVRYGVQLPGRVDVENYTMATFDDLCGVSGVGAGVLGRGCNLFAPGTLTGAPPTYDLFSKGAKQWKADTNNVAPTVGVAWRPNVESGFLRTMLGDPAQATVRAAFSVAFNSEGTDRYRAIYQANPGRTVSATRNQANGNLVLAGQSWPLLFSQRDRLGAPATCTGNVITAACYPQSLTTPLPGTPANNLAIFDPNFHASHSRQYSIGLQRAIARATAIEVRYVGTRSFGQPLVENWNEVTLIENGFVDEFKRAQANLYANIAAGRGQTFAYTGAPGTVPLPIFLASYNGSRTASDPASYAGANWTSSTNVAFLNRLNPNPAGFVSGNNGLYGNATFRANGRAAGLASNFWVLNPDVNQARFLTNALDNRYNSLQIELRRRLSDGLLFTSSYSRSFQEVEELDTIHRNKVMTYDLDHSPHAFKFFASYEIPFGNGRRFGNAAAGFVNAVAGGWNVSATSRVQSGLGLRLENVRLVGMSEKDLQKAFKIRIENNGGLTTVYNLPQDIIDNTIKAFSSDVNGYTSGAPTGRYIAPAGGPDCVAVYRGDCGPRWINVRGPISSRLDLSFKKHIMLGKSNKRIDVQYDLLNVFEAINFNPVFEASAEQDINQVTSAAQDSTQVFDPGGRLGQLVLRFSW